MNDPSGIVALARGWIGTPYRHQASCAGAGCDCLGLVRGVWRDLYGAEPEIPPAYAPDWNEARREEALWAAALRHLRPVPGLVPGRVLLFRMRETSVAKHLGILSEAGRFIHAWEKAGVVETALAPSWKRRIAAVFRFPETTDR